jgi:membrane protease YdiL (CAAX protease family)
MLPDTGNGCAVECVPPPPRLLAVRALCLAFPVVLGALLCARLAQLHLPGLSAVGTFLLGLLPFHVCGVLAVLAVFRRAVPGALPAALELDAARLPLRQAWRQAWPALLWVYPVNLALTAALAWFLHGAAGDVPVSPPLELWRENRGALLFALLLAAALLLAPLAEEILFRLVLHDALLVFGPRCAGLGAALAFAAVHGMPEQVPALFLLGLVLQDLRRRSGSLWPAVLLHAAYNGVSLLLLLGLEVGG